MSLAPVPLGAPPRKTGSRGEIVTFRGRDSTCGPLNLASWGFSPGCLQWWATLHAEFVRRTVGTACSDASSHLLLLVDAMHAKRTPYMGLVRPFRAL
jgi:hypothetical protein